MRFPHYRNETFDVIPLTVRSYYSLMWGTGAPEEICAAAKQRGYRQLALTDTDNLYGLWPFLESCRRHGITPIVGAELTDPASGRRAVCLVENETGYHRLCRLITCRHMDAAFDLKSAIPAHAQGLVVITRSPELLQTWQGTGVTLAAAAVRTPDSAAFRLRHLSGRLGVPMIAVPGSFFVNPDDLATHRMLRAIDLNTCLSRLTVRDTAPADAWLAPAAEYARRFAPWPEVIRATESIAERITFTGPAHGLVMPPWDDAAGQSAAQALRDRAYKGAHLRYGAPLPEAVVSRLEHELRIIDEKKFSSYFLVVQDIVAGNPRICGRGSGAASLVAYSLGITNVCPVKHRLYFERFLNPDRTDPPDMDIDFAWDERDDVLRGVLDRYNGRAALVCNHVTFQPRMAIREVAKVFGLAEQEIGRVLKRLPFFRHTADAGEDLLKKLKTLPGMTPADFPPPWPEIIHMARKIIGLPRHLSIHPGGVLITPGRIDAYVPVQRAAKGVRVIQWEKDAAEAAGLVKIDLLGNRSLGVIRDAIANLRRNGILFDEARWEPEDDEATRKNIARGKTMGCFYIESPAMRLLQEKARTGDFEHLVIHSSIIRPAANEFIREYLRRLHGSVWEPIHPLLTHVLDETYGIMVYQEDVAKTAVALAGFSHAQADGLRKTLSKKDRALKLTDYKLSFTCGARARGLADEQIEAVWNMMASFSGYSFCKPHSASYARISFQAAFLKTHYPAEFMAAVLSNQGGFYRAGAYVSEARRMGIRVLGPDINQSRVQWQGNGRAMRVGLLSVKHLSMDAQQAIVRQRREKPYCHMADFLERVQTDEVQARALIHAGAFDALYGKENRALMLWELACWKKEKKGRAMAGGLFAGKSVFSRPVFPPQDEKERLRNEFSVLGFLCDRHPMDLYTERLKNLPLVKAVDLPALAGRRVQTAGLLVTGKVVHTRHGDPMEFLTFEDETGLMETTFFPRAYQRFCAVLDRSRPFILHGKVEEDFGAVTLTVAGVKPL